MVYYFLSYSICNNSQRTTSLFIYSTYGQSIINQSIIRIPEQIQNSPIYRPRPGIIRFFNQSKKFQKKVKFSKLQSSPWHNQILKKFYILSSQSEQVGFAVNVVPVKTKCCKTKRIRAGLKTIWIQMYPKQISICISPLPVRRVEYQNLSGLQYSL